jgi:hypothetical protein
LDSLCFFVVWSFVGQEMGKEWAAVVVVMGGVLFLCSVFKVFV